MHLLTPPLRPRHCPARLVRFSDVTTEAMAADAPSGKRKRGGAIVKAASPLLTATVGERSFPLEFCVQARPATLRRVQGWRLRAAAGMQDATPISCVRVCVLHRAK